jgi:hypothetical protein
LLEQDFGIFDRQQFENNRQICQVIAPHDPPGVQGYFTIRRRRAWLKPRQFNFSEFEPGY